MPKSVFTDAYDTFLSMLVDARKDAGITQVDLAKKLNRPQPFVSYFERGERRIDIIEFFVIARHLGIEPLQFLAKLEKRLPQRIDI